MSIRYCYNAHHAKAVERRFFVPFLFCGQMATDIMIKLRGRPLRVMDEKRKQYFQRLKCYGFKVKVSVLSNRLAISCTTHAIGKTVSSTICSVNWEPCDSALLFTSEDSIKVDVGLRFDKYSTQYTVSVDKDFWMLGLEFCAVDLFQQQPHKTLSLIKRRKDEKVMPDHVIVENYFVRMCTLWPLLSSKYR